MISLERQVKMILVYVIAFCLLEGLIVVTYSRGNQGLPVVTETTQSITSIQTSVTHSTDTTSTLVTHAASTSTLTSVSTSTTFSTQGSSSTSRTTETTSSVAVTSSLSSTTTTTLTQSSTKSTLSSTTSSSASSTTIGTSPPLTSTTTTVQTLTGTYSTVTPLLSVSCSPAEYQLGLSTTCTGTVSNPYPTATPTGQISFLSDPPGSFTPDVCTLSGNDRSASCSAIYLASGPVTGYYTITITYSGDIFHYGGSGELTIIVAPAEGITVACYPNNVPVNTKTYCVATVSNSEDLQTPSGSVLFNTNSTGSFDQSSCVLDSSGSCSVNYIPELVTNGSTIITAKYYGDSYHAPCSNTVQLNVT